MCEDAKRFHEEANRRVDAILAHIAAAGRCRAAT